MLPKFLLADNSQECPDTIYVVHTEEPKFIVESDIEDFWANQKVHWLSEPPVSVITSYSIHYTKLYESRCSAIPAKTPAIILSSERVSLFLSEFMNYGKD